MKNLPSVKKNANKVNRIDYTNYVFSVIELVKYCGIGFSVGLIICWICYHSVYSVPLAVIVMLIYLRKKNKELKAKRQKLLLYHFKDFLSALHTSLNAGYSLENALSEALIDIRQLYTENDVMTKEIRRMLSGLKLSVPIEELFRDLGKRSGQDDIRLFSELLCVGRRQGGKLGKILNDTRHIICGKIDTEQEIDKNLSEKKYEQKIMSFMPVCIIIYLRLTFEGFIEQLYGNLPGIIIMSICLAVYACAYFIGEKIVNIEV